MLIDLILVYLYASIIYVLVAPYFLILVVYRHARLLENGWTYVKAGRDEYYLKGEYQLKFFKAMLADLVMGNNLKTYPESYSTTKNNNNTCTCSLNNGWWCQKHEEMILRNYQNNKAMNMDDTITYKRDEYDNWITVDEKCKK